MATNMGQTTISIVSIILLIACATSILRREQSSSGVFMFGALLVTSLLQLFDLCALTVSGSSFEWKRCSLFAEAFLPLCWVLASLTYSRQASPWKIGRPLQGAIIITGLLVLLPLSFPRDAFFYAPDFPAEGVLFLGTIGYFFYVFIIACMVWAMVNFEITLTNASPEDLWKIKFDIIGLGTILVVLFFYYGQSFLYRTINMTYLPLRSFMIIVGASMIFFSQKFRHGNSRVQVSRQVAFKSFVLIAIAIYLIMLSLLGEGMKYLGASFQRSLILAFIFLSGIGLVLLFLSANFRRKIKVELLKNFFQHKHDYRTQWLRFTELLAMAKTLDELQQVILSAYCNIFEIGGAALFLHEERYSGYCMTAHYKMDPISDVFYPDNSLIRFMKESAWVVNIRDDNPEILEENGYFFGENSIFVVIPLFYSDRLEGFIALGKSIHTDGVFIYEDYDLMKTISRQASLAIMHQRLSEQITQTREIEAIGNVATFVAHDLKNLVSNLSLIVENAARHLHNPDFQEDMLMSLGNTVVNMQKLIGRLKNLGEYQSIDKQQVNLLELAERTARQLVGKLITVSGTAEIVRVDESEIQKVILNLLINGIEASEPNEPVTVEVGCSDVPYIRVADKGCGMSAHFLRTGVFKPFKTTKKQGLGIGLYQCRHIIEAHGGRIEVSSAEGSGSVFTIWFATGEKTM
ncbi:MAG: XrtA/PEP-CTERM system histidine kinase PrsK [Desulfuromonadales bacterium]